MLSLAPKQLLNTEESGLRYCMEAALFLKAPRAILGSANLTPFTDTQRSGSSSSGCRVFLREEQNLWFQEPFVQSAAILWLLCSSGVGK